MITLGHQGWEEGTSLFPSSAGQEGKNKVLPSSKVEGLREKEREREEGGQSAELIIKRSFFLQPESENHLSVWPGNAGWGFDKRARGAGRLAPV